MNLPFLKNDITGSEATVKMLEAGIGNFVADQARLTDTVKPVFVIARACLGHPDHWGPPGRIHTSFCHQFV